MAFGKRQSGVGSAAQAFNANTAAAPGYAVTESAAPTGHPFRWLIILLACGAMLYGLVVSYGPDILRDHRLAGAAMNALVTEMNALVAELQRPSDGWFVGPAARVGHLRMRGR